MGLCQPFQLSRRKTLQETYTWNARKVRRRWCTRLDGSNLLFLYSMIAEFERRPFKELLEIDLDLQTMRRKRILSADVIAFHDLLHGYVQTRFETSVNKPCKHIPV